MFTYYIYIYKEIFIKNHPKPWSKDTWKSYRKCIGTREELLLDMGYGKCYLKDSQIRSIVEESIEFFHNKRYILHSYVIMPNHVHILFHMLGEYLIEKELYRMKKISALGINKATGEKGKYWDGQSYCRMIRNQEHYDNVRRYINGNPRFLRSGEFTIRNFV